MQESKNMKWIKALIVYNYIYYFIYFFFSIKGWYEMLWKTMKQRKTVKINNSICYLLILYKILYIGEGKVCTNNFHFFFFLY